MVFFCQLSTAASAELNSLKSSAIYPAGAMLFLEKQALRGVFALCGEQVKLLDSLQRRKDLDADANLQRIQEQAARDTQRINTHDSGPNGTRGRRSPALKKQLAYPILYFL